MRKRARKRSNGAGTVYPSGGKWLAAVTIPGRRRVTRTRRTETEAYAALEELQDQQRRGILDDRATVGEVLTAWLDSVSDLRPLTVRGYENNVRLHITPELGNIRVRDLTPQHVERAMQRWQSSGASPRSISHFRANLRAALNAAMRWGLVERNVASLARPVKVPRRQVLPVTLAHARRILAALEGDRLSALYTVALSRGLSRSEALGLRWEDVDFERGTLTVQRSLHRESGAYRIEEPKNEYRRRTIALPDELGEAMQRHRVRQLEERNRASEWETDPILGDLVFTTESGAPVNGTYALHHFQALLSQANLPRMTFHELRHAAVSLMAAQGVPLQTTMEIVGHSDPRTTTAIYTHVASDAHRDAADRGRALWVK